MFFPSHRRTQGCTPLFSGAAEKHRVYHCSHGLLSPSSILMDGRPLRIDMLENLEKIANLLKTQSEHFPIFKPRLLSILVEKAIGPRVDRTKKKYVDCITRYSDKDKIHGVYNVTQFCKELGA